MIAYIALGSNLGNRRQLLNRGISELAKLGQIIASPLTMETADESGTGPNYLNTVVKLDTRIDNPRTLLEECLRIEIAWGRNRNLPPNSPRTLDLDLIMVENWRGCWDWDTPYDLLQLGPELSLALPHPRARSRSFVLEPLAALGVGDGIELELKSK